MTNTKHDTTSYEKCCYKREIYNADVLYNAFLESKRGSSWKPQVQKFETNYLYNLTEIQQKLINKTFEFSPSVKFVINERGKARVINGEIIEDRIVKHALCDEVLNPSLRKYLIYDNGASLKGRGIDFTRKRLLTHLHKFYNKNKSNEGYIALLDYSKYYDNLRHDVFLRLIKSHVDDEYAIWLLEKILDKSKVDVSYMTDEEYSSCMNDTFNSLEYNNIDQSLLTGKKFMYKHFNIGDQVAQIAGIIYPMEIDNYIKIVKGEKFFSRYMDDSYIIHEDKNHLIELIEDITERCYDIGIHINKKKTRICKLSDYWRFLQIQYSLTSTGKIVEKINPKGLTTMRRKMKKLSSIMTKKQYTDWFKSWINAHYKYMSRIQIDNINKLFEEELSKCI